MHNKGSVGMACVPGGIFNNKWLGTSGYVKRVSPSSIDF